MLNDPASAQNVETAASSEAPAARRRPYEQPRLSEARFRTLLLVSNDGGDPPPEEP
jgi:hypothetical protein